MSIESAEKAKPQLTEEQMIAQLRHEGVVVEEAPKEEFPGQFNYAGLEKLDSLTLKFIGNIVEAGRKRLGTGLLVRDTFGTNHKKRREWKFAMREKYGVVFNDVLDRNRLSRNTITGFEGTLNVIMPTLDERGINPPQVDALRELHKKLMDMPSERYHELTDAEKSQFNYEFDAVLRNAMKVLTTTEGPRSSQ